MNIAKIIKLCKSEGKIQLFNDKVRGMQWLSNGFAFYPLNGAAIFDGDSFFTTFGLDSSKFTFDIYDELPLSYDFNDGNNLETVALKLDFSVYQVSQNLVAFKTEQGIEFFDNACFSPFKDYSESGLQYFIRYSGTASYLVVKNGFELIGIILPLSVINRKFVDDVNGFAKQVEMTFYNKSEELENG